MPRKEGLSIFNSVIEPDALVLKRFLLSKLNEKSTGMTSCSSEHESIAGESYISEQAPNTNATAAKTTTMRVNFRICYKGISCSKPDSQSMVTLTPTVGSPGATCPFSWAFASITLIQPAGRGSLIPRTVLVTVPSLMVV